MMTEISSITHDNGLNKHDLYCPHIKCTSLLLKQEKAKLSVPINTIKLHPLRTNFELLQITPVFFEQFFEITDPLLFENITFTRKVEGTNLCFLACPGTYN